MINLEDLKRLEEPLDFWRERLGIIGGYNSEIDQQVLDCAKLIVRAYDNKTTIYNDNLAEQVGISKTHAELIQNILASVTYKGLDGNDYRHPKTGSFAHPFTYGTSPRGLFVDQRNVVGFFIQEFEQYMDQVWGGDD